MVAEFYIVVWVVIEATVPKRKRITRSRPCIDRELRQLRNQRRKAGKKVASSGNASDVAVYDELNRQFTERNEEVHSNYLHYLTDNMASDPKKFWHHIDSKRNVKSVPDVMVDGGESVSGEQRCELFADYFHSAFSSHQEDQHNHVTTPSFVPESTTEVLSIPPINVHTIVEMKGLGPDGLPPLFFKNVCENIALPLVLIFNKSFSDGIFPTI